MKINLEDMVKLAQDTAMEVWGPLDPMKILEKLKEEVDELYEATSAVNVNNIDNVHPQFKLEVSKEFGDVLFCMVRFAYQTQLSPKDALALTVVKIQERDKFGVANVRTEEGSQVK